MVLTLILALIITLAFLYSILYNWILLFFYLLLFSVVNSLICIFSSSECTCVRYIFRQVVFHASNDALILSVVIDINSNPPAPSLPPLYYKTQYYDPHTPLFSP